MKFQEQQPNISNLESDKSAALLTQDELGAFRKLPQKEQERQREERLKKLEELQNKFRKAVEEANKTGKVEEALKLKTIFDEEAADLQELVKSRFEIDKKLIQEIYDKCFDIRGKYLNPALSKEEIKFLYEIDHQINDYAKYSTEKYRKIIANRDKKSDISFATGYTKEQISLGTDKNDFILSGNIKLHYGGIDLRKITSAKDLKLPENVIGYFNLNGLKSAENLILPKKICGPLTLDNIKSPKDLILPEYMDGSLYLHGLTSAEGLKFPKNNNYFLSLTRLTTAKGLELPEYFAGSINMENLKSAKDLKLPKNIDGGLWLDSLISAKDLILPEYIGGDLHLHHLKSAKDLKLPKSIGGTLWLNGLKSIKDLKLPEHINDDIIVRKLPKKEINELKKLYPQYKNKFNK